VQIARGIILMSGIYSDKPLNMALRNIVVIGASAGGFEALKKIVAGLPGDIDASIFIVWHISPDVRGILPQVLNKLGGLLAAHAIDKELIKPGRIYVAPPDHHMLIEKDTVRISKGPKENRFRPAIDPLFRSAALAYGPRVLGVVLSGALDDGSAGIWAVKQRGGIAIVQDPGDAEVSSMPENAMRAVEVDYRLPASELGGLLTKLVQGEATHTEEFSLHPDKQTQIEVNIAMEDKAFQYNLREFGKLSPYTCPECHGVLALIQEGGRIRFRCHTGHAFSSDSLLANITDKIEESLWSTIRNMQESIMFLNHMGDHFAENNKPKLAAMYFKKAQEAEKRADIVRQAVFAHEHLSADSIEAETGKE
jgi:two-component system chemotaxis response regulator CheB